MSGFDELWDGAESAPATAVAANIADTSEQDPKPQAKKDTLDALWDAAPASAPTKPAKAETSFDALWESDASAQQKTPTPVAPEFSYRSKPILDDATRRAQMEVSRSAAGRDATNTRITPNANPNPSHLPEPFRSIMEFGVDPMLNSPVQTTLMGATGPIGAALATLGIGKDLAEYGGQKAAELTLPPDVRKLAEADPTRISGRQAAVEAGMIGVPLLAHATGHAIGDVADVSHGMMESGAHAIRGMSEQRARAVVPAAPTDVPNVATPSASDATQGVELPAVAGDKSAVKSADSGEPAPAAKSLIGQIKDAVKGAQEKVADVVAPHLAEERRTLDRAAHTDALTGLGNQRAYEKVIPAAEADPRSSVIRFDLNGFKSVNDVAGHAAGDAALQAVAKAIHTHAADLPSFRVGGDEFAVVAPTKDAARVRDAIENAVGVNDIPGESGNARFSISGGIGATDAEADAAAIARKAQHKSEQGIGGRTEVPSEAIPAPSNSNEAAKQESSSASTVTPDRQAKKRYAASTHRWIESTIDTHPDLFRESWANRNEKTSVDWNVVRDTRDEVARGIAAREQTGQPVSESLRTQATNLDAMLHSAPKEAETRIANAQGQTPATRGKHVTWNNPYAGKLREATDEQLAHVHEQLTQRYAASTPGTPENELLHRDLLDTKNEIAGRVVEPRSRGEVALWNSPRASIESEIARHEDLLDAGLSTEDARTARRYIAVGKKRLAQMDAPQSRATYEIPDEQLATAGLKGGKIIVSPDALTHLDEAHGKELKQQGYASAKAFVDDVLGNYNAIYRGTDELGPAVYLTKRNGHAKLLIAELRPTEGGEWHVMSGRVMDAARLHRTRELLWESPRDDSGGPGSSANLSSPPHPPEVSPGSQSPTGPRDRGPQQPDAKVASEAPGAKAARPGTVVEADGTHRFVDARTNSGARRPVERVSSDGLIRELAELEPKRLDAEQRAQYRYTQDDNFHSTEDGRTVISATNKRGANGKFGPSVQAKALQNLRDYSRMLDEIHAELERRGMSAHDIFERTNESVAEREGMAMDTARHGAFDDDYDVRDESGKVLFAPGQEGADLFGEAPKDTKRTQGSLFGERAGTEASRSLKQAERAARSELETLRAKEKATSSPIERLKAGRRIAELERLVNRDQAITGDEIITRARSETSIDDEAAEPTSSTSPDQQALFSPAAPNTPLGQRIASTLGISKAMTIKSGAKVKSLGVISRELAQLVDVPLRQGRFGAGKYRARGAFFPTAEVARVIRFDHLDTAAHEVGHYISQEYLRNPTQRNPAVPRSGAPIALTRAMKVELVKMGKDLYGSRAPAGGYGEEGIAQWAKFYVTDPARLAADAPEFSRHMDQVILPSEPAIEAAMKQARRDFADYVAAPATARVDAMIDVKPSRRFLPNPRELATMMLDDLYEIRRAGEEIGTSTSASKDAYILARLTRGSAGIAEEMLERGIVVRGQRVAPGLTEVLRQLKPEDVQPFRRYLAAERTLEVAQRGVNSGISTADAHAVVQLYAPKYRVLAEDVWKISNALIDYREEHGLLTAQEAAQIKAQNQRRVGFYRVFDEDETASSRGFGKGFGRNSSGVQAIRGSAREIIDPLESMVTDHYKTVKQAKSAEVLRVLVEHAANTQGGGRVVDVLHEAPQERVVIPVDRVKDQLAQLGFQAPNGGLGPMQGILESFRDATSAGPKESKELVRPLVINGERKWVQINDAPLYNALGGLDVPQLPQWLRMLGAPTRMLRVGATLTAEFIARNPVRDAVDAAILTRAGGAHGVPLVSVSRGLFHLIGHDELYQEWRVAGGDNAAMLGIDRVDVQKHVKQLMRSRGKEAADWVLHPIDTLRMLSSITENATRLGEYAGMRAKAIARGASIEDARAESALASRDVTIDFARAGTVSRQVNSIMAFFNANIQGFDRLSRELRARPQVIVPRIAAWITLPSVALYLAQRDDPAYQEVPRWQKLAAWVIVDRDAAGNLKHVWRIPKPPELGLLFGSIPEQILDWVHTKDPHALSAIWQGMQTQLNPVHIPEFLTPLVEWWANKNRFTDRPIVPQGAQNLPAGEQATSRTGEAARALGGAIGASPAKIENTVRGYTGGLGQYGMDIGNMIVRSSRKLLDLAPLPTPLDRRTDMATRIPVLKGFAVHKPELDAQSVQDAMDAFATAEAHRQAWRQRLAAGDRRGANLYFQAHKEEIKSVATKEDHLGGSGPLKQARDVIADAQTLSKDADDAMRRHLADVAIATARRVLGRDESDGAAPFDIGEFRRALHNRKAQVRRNLRAPEQP